MFRSYYLFFRILVCLLPSVASAQWTLHPGAFSLNFPTEIAFWSNTFYLADANGLLRSSNFGQTWQSCTLGPIEQSALQITAGPDGVFAGLADGSIWVSLDNGVSWNAACPNAPTGVRYLATLDGDIFAAGENNSLSVFRAATNDWMLVNSNATSSIKRLAVQGSRIWASSASGVTYSDDHGVSWQPTSGLSDFTDIMLAGNVLWALNPNVGFKTSNNGGQTWTTGALGNASGAKRACYDQANNRFYFIRHFPVPGFWDVWSYTPGTGIKRLTAYKQNPSIISANSGVVLAVTTQNILRSTDDGNHWRSETNGFSAYSGEDLPLAAGDPILIGYVNLSLNEGATTFHPLDSAAGPYGLVNFARVGDHLFALDVWANYRNLYRSVPPYSDWPVRDTSWIFAATNGKLVGQGPDLLYIANTPNTKKIYRSSDEGLSWQPSGSCPLATVSAIVHHGLLFAVDANDQVWRSIDGMDWTAVAQLPEATNYTLKSENDQIVASHLALFPEECFMRSKDDGLNWTKINTNLLDPFGIGFTAASVLGDTLALANGPGCWISLNGGNTWIDATDNLPSGYLTNLYFYKGQLFRSGLPNYVRFIDNLSPVKATGTVFLDQNNNGVRDATEPPLPDYLVKMRRSGALRLTDTMGNFLITGTLSPDTLEVILPASYGQVSPAFATIDTLLAGQEFGVWYPPGQLDRRISLVALDPFRPGFPTRLQVHCQNVGAEESAATIRLTLPEVLQIASLDPATGVIAGDSVVWEMSSFPMFGQAVFMLTVNTPTNVALGTTLTFSAQISPINGDLQAIDNVDTSTFTVVGAYDPNDKQVNQGAIVTPNQLSDGRMFQYTIRFQNTGNYPTEVVRVVDTLQSSLDPATFRLVAASHPVQVSLHHDRVFEFRFDPIHLSPALSDPEGSQGFVQFSIQPVSELKIGDQILNDASIYFDYNLPILTNTCQVDVSATLQANGVFTAPELLIYPNPTSERFGVNLPDYGVLEVFDAQGRSVFARKVVPGFLQIEVRNWPTGVYAVVWRGEHQTSVGRLVRQ